MTEAPISAGRPVVVVADDDYGNRLALIAVLEPLATVVAFDSGNAALKHLLDHPSCAAVILDVHMGSTSGFEVARLLRQRQRTKEIPVIFLTGTMRDSALEGYAEGAFDFMLKPFDPDALRAKVTGLVKLYAQRQSIERDRDASMQREHTARVETAAQRRYLYDFLAQAPGLVARLRGPKHVFEFANAEYLAAMGAQDIVGEPFREAFPETAQRGLLETLDNVYRTGVPANASEVALTLTTAAGPETAYFNFVYQPIRAIDGTVEGILLHGTNVSDQVNARKAIEALSLQLAASADEAKRLTTLQQQLLAIVGHDLRNPLHAIVANARLLQQKPGDAALAAAAIPRIARSALRMNQLIGELFDFTQARLTGGIKVIRETCNIADLCKQVIDELATVHPGRVITLDASSDITGAWDCGRLQQVISNLVANGLQYSPRESALSVRVEDRSSEILLQVRNEGPAIPAELMGELFEPFKRGGVEERRGNLGLGLYIVDQVVRAHGGSVEVSSTEAAGTTFTVRLPRAA